MVTEAVTEKEFNEFVDFCAVCGTVLPLPEFSDESHNVECPLCHQTVGADKFDGITTKTRVVFNERESAGRRKKILVPGAIVDHECPKCRHDKATFTTAQTRSADEGQTCYYTCKKCDHLATENS